MRLLDFVISGITLLGYQVGPERIALLSLAKQLLNYNGLRYTQVRPKNLSCTSN